VRPYLEKTLHKKAGGVAQGVGPEFKPHSNAKKKKKKKENVLGCYVFKKDLLQELVIIALAG
jgi:hypothetical protein